jgi:hypothetical protein
MFLLLILIYAFDTNAENRRNQDVGWMVCPMPMKAVYTNFIGIDPAADDYTFYLNTDGGILNGIKIIMESMGIQR